MPPASTTHAFRYEPSLCSLGDGQTLADWRKDAGAARKARRRRRLRPTRAASRRQSDR